MEKGFMGLMAWQKAYALALEIYKVTKEYPKDELYGLTSQMRRAAISVSANIAEGYERQYRKSYLQFLMIANGSLGEVESYLLLSKDLGYIDDRRHAVISDIRQDTGRLLKGLIRSLQA